MKEYITPFSNSMEKLSNNEHAQKIFWIVLCTVFSCGIALIPMLMNYRNLWTFTASSLDRTIEVPASATLASPQRVAR